MPNNSIDLIKKSPPIQGFRFRVVTLTSLLLAGVKPFDMRFNKISGLDVSIEERKVKSGGQNLHDYRFPANITYGNLIMERGMVNGTIMGNEFNLAMSTFSFTLSNILVQLLDEEGGFVAGWLFIDAFPVKWSFSDLDASNSGVVVEKLEYAYSRFQTLKY